MKEREVCRMLAEFGSCVVANWLKLRGFTQGQAAEFGMKHINKIINSALHTVITMDCPASIAGWKEAGSPSHVSVIEMGRAAMACRTIILCEEILKHGE